MRTSFGDYARSVPVTRSRNKALPDSIPRFAFRLLMQLGKSGAGDSDRSPLKLPALAATARYTATWSVRTSPWPTVATAITYSMLGSGLLQALIERRQHPLAELFSFRRLG
jgi:hypothetical protein